MDFDLRQWLLILGPLFIAGVLVHGYFRMRSGQNNIRMKLDRDFVSKPGLRVEDEDELKMLRAELPNGGARVIRRKPDLEEDVPLLMESVELPSVSAKEEPPARQPQQQRLTALDEPADEVPKAAVKTRKAPPANPVTKEPPAVFTDRESTSASRTKKTAKRTDEPVQEEAASEEAPAPRVKKPATPKPEKFVVLHVIALDAHFQGQSLVELLVDAEMQHGEMSIFHRLDAAGAPLFSLASAVEPGTFDMSTIDSFSTPGVTLFMRVHELEQPLRVLEEMLDVADTIAQELGGEVRDETRSVMTPQTIEHCRQSIREFQFKHSA